jgi:hypothetical protein
MCCRPACSHGWRPGRCWKVNACPNCSSPRCVTWGNRPPGAAWRHWPRKTRSWCSAGCGGGRASQPRPRLPRPRSPAPSRPSVSCRRPPGPRCWSRPRWRDRSRRRPRPRIPSPRDRTGAARRGAGWSGSGRFRNGWRRRGPRPRRRGLRLRRHGTSGSGRPPSCGRAVGRVRRACRACLRHRGSQGHQTRSGRRGWPGRRREPQSMAPAGAKTRRREPGGIRAWPDRLARAVTRRRPGRPRRSVMPGPGERGQGIRARAVRSPMAQSPMARSLVTRSSAVWASRPGIRGRAGMRAPAGRWSVTARPRAPGPLIRLGAPGLTIGSRIRVLAGITVRAVMPAQVRTKVQAGPRARAGRPAIGPTRARGQARWQGLSARTPARCQESRLLRFGREGQSQRRPDRRPQRQQGWERRQRLDRGRRWLGRQRRLLLGQERPQRLD